MKLRDITNSQCDVRKYMSIEIPDEARYELENWDYDVDDVLRQARIYIDGHKLDDEIIPFNVEKHLEINENQQIVLDYLTSETRFTKEAPLLSINNFSENHFGAKLPEKVEEAYRKLNAKEDYEVLSAFAEWGMKEAAE